MHDTYTLKELQNNSNRMGKPSRKSRGRRLSLDPTTKIKVEKLEVVSKFIFIRFSVFHLLDLSFQINDD